MKHSARRLRSDSADAAVLAMRNAQLPELQPPAHVPLRAGDEPFFRDVVRERARDEWTEATLAVAVELASVMRDRRDQQVLLDKEGWVVAGPSGMLRKNPRAEIVDQLSKREMALMRTLRMGGRSLGATDKLEPRRNLERAALELVHSESLLA